SVPSSSSPWWPSPWAWFPSCAKSSSPRRPCASACTAPACSEKTPRLGRAECMGRFSPRRLRACAHSLTTFNGACARRSRREARSIRTRQGDERESKRTDQRTGRGRREEGRQAFGCPRQPEGGHGTGQAGGDNPQACRGRTRERHEHHVRFEGGL